MKSRHFADVGVKVCKSHLKLSYVKFERSCCSDVKKNADMKLLAVTWPYWMFVKTDIIFLFKSNGCSNVICPEVYEEMVLKRCVHNGFGLYLLRCLICSAVAEKNICKSCTLFCLNAHRPCVKACIHLEFILFFFFIVTFYALKLCWQSY